MELKTLSEYAYYQGNGDFYYISSLNVIVDSNKNIIYDSNISLTTNTDFLNFVKRGIHSIDLNKYDCTYENVIYIQHWFMTYGHFMDELFNLYNFHSLFSNANYNVLINYKKPNHIEYSFDNYKKLSDLLFEPNKCINALENNNITKLSNLILIKHHLNSPMFHIFPKVAINKILSRISNDNINFNKNIFITRGKAGHLPRNLDNQSEIEQYFLSINYNVINPEIMDIELFINTIKNAENIYITWGGAMTNLCYVNPNSNIYLLQSLSYRNENLFSIFKFLRNYTNLYLIKCNDDNTINLNFENKIKIHHDP
jgi:hypothetical protein